MLTTIIKNGMYIHVIHAALTYTYNFYLASCISIKLYSINYFYWYGHLLNYLKNPRLNWVKQFIRFTDTGHIASFMIILYPQLIPLSHNVLFIIMAGYWLGKFVFNLKDADKLNNALDLNDSHTDMCTYIHHSVPYILIIRAMRLQTDTTCELQYSNSNLNNTYIWLYVWFLFVYLPWRRYTGDTVYSILDSKVTPMPVIISFVGFIHLLVYISNWVGYMCCSLSYIIYNPGVIIQYGV